MRGKAAKQGLKWAQETLSIMYFRGIGTDNICEIPANILDKRAFFHYSRIQKKAVKRGVGGNAPQRGKLISWKVSREQKR
ncbi:hypothetical protein DWY47_02055 [Ruminococcus sp. AF25-23LB]|nr:hypothetical protein DWY47_02055 [Ruminococcus sp. AF25-23LB]